MSELRLVTLADRRAVYALLDRLLDWLPPARLSVARDTSTKAGTGTWSVCGTCGGTGRLLGGKPCRQPHAKWPFGHGCAPCPVCSPEGGDYGHTLELPPRGQPLAGTDRMLIRGVHGLHDEAQAKAERRRYVDAQLAQLEATARQRAGLESPDDDLTRALSAKTHLYRTGSFQHLDAALRLLEVSDRRRFEFVRLTAIEGIVQVTERMRPALDGVVDWVGERMPRPILLPADAVNEVEAWKVSLQLGKTAAHRKQRDQRNREIVELAAEHGWSQRRIATHYALSQPAVQEILAKTEAVASGTVAA